MKRNIQLLQSGKQKIMMFFTVILLVSFVTMLTGCGGSGDSDDGTTSTTDTTSAENSESSASSFDVNSLEESDYDPADYSWSSTSLISLADTGISISGTTGASASGSVLTISSAGTYSISGKLSDGRIIVDTDDEGVVRLVFTGVEVACSYSAPFYVANGNRTAILLADNSDNILTDSATYTYFDDEEDSEPNAALHSRDYLTIGVPADSTGSGSLTVNGNYNDAITSKDGLVINGGNITVNALDDGIRGKDYLIVKKGVVSVTTAEGDGFKSDNDEDTSRGYVTLEDGVIDVDAACDGIQAQTYVIAYGGDVTIKSGNGIDGSPDDSISKKGIKGSVGVFIENGDFTINSADDAIHSNDFVIVKDGIYTVTTGDDGIHADLDLEIYDGDFSITDCYEGIESYVISIAGGNIFIESDDDGLNAAGGVDSSGINGGFDGGMPTSGSGFLYIDGGYIAIYSNGDSLDSNGSIEMTAGTVLVHGPSNDNSALDFNGSFTIDGGFLVTAGGTGMGVQSPSTSSAQNYAQLTFSEESSGTMFHIESSDGATDIVSFKPAKKYTSILISSPDLADGTTYDVYFDGSYAGGTSTDGLYEDGVYSPGTQYTSFSL